MIEFILGVIVGVGASPLWRHRQRSQQQVPDAVPLPAGWTSHTRRFPLHRFTAYDDHGVERFAVSAWEPGWKVVKGGDFCQTYQTRDLALAAALESVARTSSLPEGK